MEDSTIQFWGNLNLSRKGFQYWKFFFAIIGRRCLGKFYLIQFIFAEGAKEGLFAKEQWIQNKKIERDTRFRRQGEDHQVNIFEAFLQILMIRFLSGIEEVVDRIFEEKNKERELLLPVTETELKPQSKFLTCADTETERQAYFKGDGIRRGYDIEVR